MRNITLLAASLLIAGGGLAHAAPVSVNSGSCTSGLATVGVCSGTIDFTLGTPLPNETHIFLDAATGVKSFTGEVGQNAPTTDQALFTTDVNVDVKNGFATVKPSANKGDIGSLTFSLALASDPTQQILFHDFLFDVQLDSAQGKTSPFSIEVFGTGNALLGSWTFGADQLKANADLSFLGVSQDGADIAKYVISGDPGMLEAKHFQISGPGFVPTVPLPGALPLFASGLAGLGWLARRRRGQTVHT